MRIVSFLPFVLLGSVSAGAADAPAGKDVWTENCVLCHGEKGAPAPAAKSLGVADLSSPTWQASRTDAQIRKVIADGPAKPDTLMRAFKDELSDEEIDAVVKYVRTLAAKPKAPSAKK